MNNPNNRRFFLKTTALVAGTAALACAEVLGQEKRMGGSKENEEEVTPVEDLAREHGLLNRVLLIYDELNNRLATGSNFDPALLIGSAEIIQRFIEGYHEKLEEEYLFPRFMKAGRLTDLIGVLRQQHNAGRALTSRILQFAKNGPARNSTESKNLGQAVSAFVRMYRPHEAREDTVLFPALRSIVSENEYNSLGEEFEKKEHQLFGKEGFEGVLDQVSAIEKKLGIYDLSQFTLR